MSKVLVKTIIERINVVTSLVLGEACRKLVGN